MELDYVVFATEKLLLVSKGNVTVEMHGISPISLEMIKMSVFPELLSFEFTKMIIH